MQYRTRTLSGTASICLLVNLSCIPMEIEDGGAALGPLDLPTSLFNYSEPDLPDHFLNSGLGTNGENQFYLIRDHSPPNNLVTDAGATLGRVLFYEPQLSRNETISCSSCHRPEFGFSDDRVLSEGFLGGETGRHSMGLTNARYTGNGRYFWDERAGTLEEQVLMPIQDEVEMGMTLDEVVQRLSAVDYYPSLFLEAFGDEQITEERISFALAQFVRSLMSYTSPYDLGRQMVASPTYRLSQFQWRGKPRQTTFRGWVCGWWLQLCGVS